jgi:hypothetical protein
VNLPGGAAVDLQVSATVLEHTAAAQRIGILFLPSVPLTGLQVRAFVNTQFFTNTVDYAANPTPPGGESFVMFGYRSVAGETMPAAVGATLEVRHGAGLGGRDDIVVQLASTMDQPRTYLLGQFALPTALATYTAPGFGNYRRAVEGNLDGLRAALSVHAPGVTGQTWLHVTVSNPRTDDNPLRQVQPAEATGPGDVPLTGKRRYRVTWVYDNGNESGATPPSEAISTTTGAISVPLPVWAQAPPAGNIPGIGGPSLPVRRRRVYRTLTTETGDDGEYFLVDERADNTSTTFVDRVADDDLDTGNPLLTDIAVTVSRSADQAGNNLLAGTATLDGVIETSDREQNAAGTTQFRGTAYVARLSGVPARGQVSFTTRPAAGRPRVEWRFRSNTGPAGITEARLEVQPQGVAVGVDQPLRAVVSGGPAEVGVDWQQEGERLRLAVGRPDDVTQPLVAAPGAVAFATAPTLPATQLVASERTVAAVLDDTASSLWGSVRGLLRFRLLLGHNRPAGEPGPHYAVDGNGVVANLDLAPRPGRGRPDRSLFVRRTSPDGDLRLVEARVGALPDSTWIDLRPSGVVAGRLQGRARRVTAFVQGRKDTVADIAGARRHDGIYVACPDTRGQVDFVVDADRAHVEFTPEGSVRLDATARRPNGFTQAASPGDLVIRAIHGSLTAEGRTVVDAPPAGAGAGPLVAVASGGTTGVVGIAAVPSDDTTGATFDAFRPARATPQVGANFSSATPAVSNLERATARVIGVQELSIARAPATDHRVRLAPSRANAALRGELVVNDSRFTPSRWSLVKARCAHIPPVVSLRADIAARSFSLVASERAGELVLFSEPAIIPTDGAASGSVVGLGLARATIEGLPTQVDFDLLGPGNPRQDEPFNWSPPAGWRKSGFRIDTDGPMVIRGLQLIGVDFSRPAIGSTPVTHFWTNTAAAFVGIAADPVADGDPPKVPGPVWLWTPGEGLPSGSAPAGDWEDLEAAIGFRVEPDALMTLQLNSYKDSSASFQRWNTSAMTWVLQAEFQMKDYRNEGTLTPGSLSATGNPDVGPGLWYLRLPDAAPFSGQVVFGNTGGWVSNRPRIFASFTPTPGSAP